MSAPLLPPGASIAIVAPSHAFFEDRYQRGIEILEGWGYRTIEAEGLRRRHRYLAGDDDHRLDTLVSALTAPGIDAVWAARGGSGVTRLLSRIPWTALPSRTLIGFSDLTPLLDQLGWRGLPAVHGPVVHSLGSTDDASLEHLRALLAGEPLAALRGDPLVPGRAEGPLVGGNLCMIAATCGTPFQLDASGCVLVLEEIGEHPYKVDRMLQQLRDAGVLHGIRGVALGTFTGCEAPQGADYALRDVLLDQLGDLGVPVARDLPIGHGAENMAFIVRSQGLIDDGVLTLGGWPALTG